MTRWSRPRCMLADERFRYRGGRHGRVARAKLDAIAEEREPALEKRGPVAKWAENGLAGLTVGCFGGEAAP